MKIRRFLLKLSIMIAPLAAALALGGPEVSEAATVIIVDSGLVASNCGSYTGDPSQNNLVNAVNNATNNSTIVICPGTFTMTNEVLLSGKRKITLKPAVADQGDRPVIRIASGASHILNITNSPNTTVDGLILDATNATLPGTIVVGVIGSAATIKNMLVIGPDTGPSVGIQVFATGSKIFPVSISKSYVVGYYTTGIMASGAVKLSVSETYLDGTDGGRITAPASIGVSITGSIVDPVSATGSVTKSRILNHATGVSITGASKVSVTNNTLAHNKNGVSISDNIYFQQVADNVKVTGNSIMGVTGTGIYVYNGDAAHATIKNATISNNFIAVSTYANATSYGITVSADTLAGPNVSGKISNNTLPGFSSINWIVFNQASMTTSNNTIMP